VVSVSFAYICTSFHDLSLQWLMFSKTVSVSSFRKPLHTFVMF